MLTITVQLNCPGSAKRHLDYWVHALDGPLFGWGGYGSITARSRSDYISMSIYNTYARHLVSPDTRLTADRPETAAPQPWR